MKVKLNQNARGPKKPVDVRKEKIANTSKPGRDPNAPIVLSFSELDLTLIVQAIKKGMVYEHADRIMKNILTQTLPQQLTSTQQARPER